MSVLGVGGRLVLKRQKSKERLTLNQSNLDSTCNRISGAPNWIWNGDQIHVENLPIYGANGVPGRADGFATYFGSKWYLGPNRTQITNNTDKFYKTSSESYPSNKAGDQANFYSKEGVAPVPVDSGANGDYWVHIDQSGYISFYTSRCKALAGISTDRIALAPLDGDIKLGAVGTIDYQNSDWECVPGPCSGATSDYEYSNIDDPADPDDGLCQRPSTGNQLTGTEDYENSNVTGNDFPDWEVICGLREWTIQLTADTVDTTSVSEKFGTAVKSFVNGGGSLEFFIDRDCGDAAKNNSMLIMQLLMMTEKGCEADAEFWLMDRPIKGESACGGSIGGGLYYQAKILITSTAVNLRPTELVAGTANFVTTETIRLLEAG